MSNETGRCWFCRRDVPVDSLIAGYDTFEEQRLACNTCDEAIGWLARFGWSITQTEIPVVPRYVKSVGGIGWRFGDRAVQAGHDQAGEGGVREVEPLPPEQEELLRQGFMPDRPYYVVPRLLASLDAARASTELDVERLARAEDIVSRRHHDPEHGPYRGLDNDPILASMMREEAAELAAEYAALAATESAE